MVGRLLQEMPRALARWKRSDPVLARTARTTRLYQFKDPTTSAFSTLFTSIINQQVSLAAGRTIVRRVRAACAGRLTPAAILALGDDRLQPLGVSRQKRGYVLDLAARFERGEVDSRRLGRASDEEVIASLTSVKGIGDWTAKMFLMFHLQRPDVVAPEDLGLQHGARLVYGVPMARAARFLERRSEAWRPFRTLGCLTLWSAKDSARGAKI